MERHISPIVILDGAMMAANQNRAGSDFSLLFAANCRLLPSNQNSTNDHRTNQRSSATSRIPSPANNY